MSAITLALLAVGAGSLAWMSWVERRHAIAWRRAMLDDCAALFDEPVKTVAPDGFPKLSGRVGMRHFQMSLLPDTFTVKRLPQLWLVMRRPASLAMPALTVTARPRGDDFVSVAMDMRRHLSVPIWLPKDCAVRGDNDAAALWLTKLRAPLEAAFGDPRLKEISLAPQGVRLVFGVGEGRRGAHLLLRQACFETRIDLAVARRCHAIICDIEKAVGQDLQRAAA